MGTDRSAKTLDYPFKCALIDGKMLFKAAECLQISAQESFQTFPCLATVGRFLTVQRDNVRVLLPISLRGNTPPSSSGERRGQRAEAGSNKRCSPSPFTRFLQNKSLSDESNEDNERKQPSRGI